VLAHVSQLTASIDRSFATVDRAISVHVVQTGRPGGRPGAVLAYASAILAPFIFRSLRYLLYLLFPYKLFISIDFINQITNITRFKINFKNLQFLLC